MNSRIEAIKIRKQWSDWIKKNLTQSKVIEEGQGLWLQQQLKQKIRDGGDRLSFELKLISLTDSISIVMKCMNHKQSKKLIAFVGDPLVPVVIDLDFVDLMCFLKHVAEADQTTTLASCDLDGNITLDLPKDDSCEGEMLVSCGGIFEQVVVNLQNLRTDGIQFRGN